MFEALLKLNQALDPDQRLPRSAFELDSRVRAQLENEVKARVQEVQQEMAWETEKHEIQLRKLRNHFLAPLEVELIGLKAFRSGLTVHSFRAPALPPFVVEALRKVRDYLCLYISTPWIHLSPPFLFYLVVIFIFIYIYFPYYRSVISLYSSHHLLTHPKPLMMR